MFARLRSSISRRFSRTPSQFQRAQWYVATDEVSGQIQFDILKREGLTPQSTLLEIGCGCLNAGVRFIQFLDRGNYVGVDPNPWLREAAIKKSEVCRLLKAKRPTFLSNEHFDASELGRKFDFIFSHSILSHAAHHQLDEYLKNTAAMLTNDGISLASIRLAEGNKWGSDGSPHGKDTMDDDWVYPGVSFFTVPTIKSTANRYDFSAEIKPELTEFYVARRPAECHDWVLFRRRHIT